MRNAMSSRRIVVIVMCVVAGIALASVGVVSVIGANTHDSYYLEFERDDSTVYLFPTIHFLPLEYSFDDVIAEPVFSALEDSDVLFLESDPADMPHQSRFDELRWSDSSEERRSVAHYFEDLPVADEDADEIWAEIFGVLQADSAERRDEIREMRPHALWRLLSDTVSLPVQSPWDRGIDNQLRRFAIEQMIPTAGLESWTLPLELRDGVDQEPFVLSMACTILAGVDRERAVEALEESLNEIYTMWRRGIGTLLDEELALPDPEEFEGEFPEEVEEICADPDTEAAKERSDAIMLTREQKWVGVIDDYVRENNDETIFIAVGLGHLHEDFDGKLPELLKDAGFERVR